MCSLPCKLNSKSASHRVINAKWDRYDQSEKALQKCLGTLRIHFDAAIGKSFSVLKFIKFSLNRQNFSKSKHYIHKLNIAKWRNLESNWSMPSVYVLTGRIYFPPEMGVHPSSISVRGSCDLNLLSYWPVCGGLTYSFGISGAQGALSWFLFTLVLMLKMRLLMLG
jgi:hypothetical protein